MLFLALLSASLAQDCQPFGVRLSLGESYNPVPYKRVWLRITFNTPTECTSIPVTFNKISTLNCTTKELSISAPSYNVNYNYTTYIHVCQVPESIILTFQNGSAVVPYEIGGSTYEAVLPDPMQKVQTYLVIGDWGLLYQFKGEYDDIMPCLKDYLGRMLYTAVIFVGDLAYDLQSKNCMESQAFFKAIEFLTARLPFMVAPGNHQNYKRRKISGSIYNESMQMPLHQVYDNYFYSFTVGRTHFIMFDPFDEIYQTGQSNTSGLIKAIEDDLKRQTEHDWLIPFSHYPGYCSYLEDPGDQHCVTNRKLIRDYLTLFNQKNAQLFLSGHVHLYERMFPINEKDEPSPQPSKNQSEDGLTVPVYENPDGPIYIVQGDAGQDYYLRDTPYPLTDVTAFSGINSGFGVMTIYNNSVLKYVRVRVGNETLGRTCFVEDAVYLVQENKTVWYLFAVLGLVLIIAVLVIARWWYIKRDAAAAERNPLMSRHGEEVI